MVLKWVSVDTKDITMVCEAILFQCIALPCILLFTSYCRPCKKLALLQGTHVLPALSHNWHRVIFTASTVERGHFVPKALQQQAERAITTRAQSWLLFFPRGRGHNGQSQHTLLVDAPVNLALMSQEHHCSNRPPVYWHVVAFPPCHVV